MTAHSHGPAYHPFSRRACSPRPAPSPPARGPSRAPHALATVFALIMVGLVASTLTATAILLHSDVRRTASLRSDAQLRQLLLVGIADATSRAESWPQTPPAARWDIPLPHDLRLAGATLSARAMPANSSTIVIILDATEGGRRAAEQLQFKRSADRWHLSAIRLDAAPAGKKAK